MSREDIFNDIDPDILVLILIAQNTRVRVASRLTTSLQTGYQIRCEVDMFGRKPIPHAATQFLADQGLPTQNRYTQKHHINRILRLLKPFTDYTKDPQGF